MNRLSERSIVAEHEAASATPADAPRETVRAPILRDVIVQGAAVLIAATAIVLLIRGLLDPKTVQSHPIVQILLALATVTGVCWGAWQRYRLWTSPVRQLGQILDQVRQGELPVDEISKIGGVPAILVPALRELLSDLRRQRAQIQQLQLEMGQRVANRTDALERAMGTLREKASRDALSGLYNRRMMEDTLPRLVDRCRAENRTLCVLMIDVDYFKTLNDTLGHAAGDDLLRDIGQIIRSSIRAADLAFRCGGDEFVIVMVDADVSSGHAMSERLISLVDALAKTLRVEKPPRLSIGMAHLSDCVNATAAELLESADRALYEIKGKRKRSALPEPHSTATPKRLAS